MKNQWKKDNEEYSPVDDIKKINKDWVMIIKNGRIIFFELGSKRVITAFECPTDRHEINECDSNLWERDIVIEQLKKISLQKNIVEIQFTMFGNKTYASSYVVRSLINLKTGERKIECLRHISYEFPKTSERRYDSYM